MFGQLAISMPMVLLVLPFQLLANFFFLVYLEVLWLILFFICYYFLGDQLVSREASCCMAFGFVSIVIGFRLSG